MSFETLLRELQAEFNPVLARFFDRQEPRAREISPAAHSAFEVVKDLTLRGGKRLRPLLLATAFEGYGGDDRARILEAACSIELMQTFLLIHDDIMDRSDLRRGHLSAHRRFEEAYRGCEVPELERFGASLAILAGDAAAAYGSLALTTAGFPAEPTVQALDLYSRIVVDETFGQILDLRAEFQHDLDEKAALDVFYYKTTRYTVEGPLHLGAALAEAPAGEPAKLSAFARPLGNAFQLQDDVLGLFGEEAKVGKPVGSDLQEGKTTLLIVKALESASTQQRATLESALGNPDLTPPQIREAQAVLEETGALDHCRRRIAGWIEDAKTALDACSLDAPSKHLLAGFSDYLLTRQT